MTIVENPRAIVTGGASGLGRALCLELGKRRARVLVADRDLTGAEATAARVGALGGRGEAVLCDVSKLSSVEALADAADNRFGGVDLVINNAGVAVAGEVGAIPMKEWEWLMSVNLWGVIYGCHVFAPRFKKQRSGHILNVGSAAGLLSLPEMGPYNVSKAGVIALSETLYSELARHDVGVTVLCPTFFQTAIMQSAHTTTEGALDRYARERMKASRLQAEDVARIALASCDRNDLYCVPMTDGRWMWRFKRLVPETYYRRFMPQFRRLVETTGRGKRRMRAQKQG